MPRYAEEIEQLVVPVLGPEVEQRSTRGVGRIGDMHLAAGELPQQPAIDRAEGEFALFGTRARAFDVVEDPADLSAKPR